MLHIFQAMTVATFDHILGVHNMAEGFMLHTIQTMTVATFDHILGALNMTKGFDAAHHSGNNGGHI